MVKVIFFIFFRFSPPARHRSTSSCLFILLVFRVCCVCVFQPHHLSAAPQTENKENCDRRHWGAESLAVYFFQHNHQVNIQRTIFTGILAEPFYGGLRLRIFEIPETNSDPAISAPAKIVEKVITNFVINFEWIESFIKGCKKIFFGKYVTYFISWIVNYVCEKCFKPSFYYL